MMTREKMKAIQAEPKDQVIRHHSCTCGSAPGTKPEHRTTEPLIRTQTGYACSRCGREA